MATSKKKAETTDGVIIAEVPAIDLKFATIHLVGDSPLIVHKWSEKAKKEILDKQQKKAKTTAHEIRDPVKDFIESIYWLSGEPEEKTEEAFVQAVENGAKFGFPATAFKAAAVAAGYRSGILPNKVTANAAFHIDCEMAEILGTPSPREDMVRIGLGSADLRYRGEFCQWEVNLPVKYNAAAISLEQVVNLFNLGGFACGVGEWRIEKGGRFGGFHVE